MKTTVEIADHLLVTAKSLAKERGWTLRMVLEDSLSTYFDRSSAKEKPYQFQPRIVTGKGLQPGLSWSQLPELNAEDLDRT